MAILIIRLVPATRFIPRIAQLQKALRFRAEDVDIDPGVLLAVIPDTADLDRIRSMFDASTVTGQVRRAALQSFHGKELTVLELDGDVAELVQDFESFSMLKDLEGAVMTIASKPADPSTLEAFNELSGGGVIEFDRLELLDLDTGRLMQSYELGEDETDEED